MLRLQVLRVGLRELAANRLRTMLTGLGMVFGVAAVIAMVSIAEGARFEAVRQIEALGTNAIWIRAVQLTGHELSIARQRGVKGLSLDDAEAVVHLPGVRAVAPIAETTLQVRRGDRSAEARIVGTTPSHADVVGRSVERGRYLHDADVRERRPVAVLGASVARELLPFRDPVGVDVSIGSTTFRVIGVLPDPRAADGRGSVVATRDPGRDVHVPVTTLALRFPAEPTRAPLSEVGVRVDEGADVRQVAALVGAAVARRHEGVADLEVVVPEELLRQSQRSQQIFNVVMGAIASISLIVGGIGIMNVMLVTVVQRTREIGVRRACGATRADVRDQFLAEALAIAIGGGGAGAVLGAGLAAGIAAYAGWVTIVSLKAVAAAFVVAGSTGVAFGLFPAVKASKLDPMECLRHE